MGEGDGLRTESAGGDVGWGESAAKPVPESGQKKTPALMVGTMPSDGDGTLVLSRVSLRKVSTRTNPVVAVVVGRAGVQDS